MYEAARLSGSVLLNHEPKWEIESSNSGLEAGIVHKSGELFRTLAAEEADHGMTKSSRYAGSFFLVCWNSVMIKQIKGADWQSWSMVTSDALKYHCTRKEMNSCFQSITFIQSVHEISNGIYRFIWLCERIFIETDALSCKRNRFEAISFSRMCVRRVCFLQKSTGCKYPQFR